VPAVSATDYFEARQLQRLGGPLLVYALAKLSEERTRSAARATTTSEAPPPTGVVRTAPEREAERSGRRIDYRPDAPARFTIHLSYGGVERMRGEIAWGAQQGVEVGGYLWAHRRAGPERVVVAHVSPPADGSLHGPTAVKLGRPESVAANWPDWLSRSELMVVGDWHSHPVGDGTPSRTDRENWAWNVQSSDGFPWATVIVIRGEDGLGWMGPRYVGWLTSADGRGGYICEPATVAEP
jgi:proteasome lid subunit RPN8/RPN11